MLTAAQQASIEAAVTAAERRTNAEFAVVVANSSDDYAGFPLVWAGAAALLAGGAVLLLWPSLTAPELFWGEAALYAVVALGLSYLPARASLAPGFVREDRARAMADLQFAARVEGRTAEGVGLLLFLSLAEHVAEIRVDARIAAAVPQSSWQTILDELVASIHSGTVADAIAQAVAASADKLADPFPPRTDQANEIANRVAQL